MISAKTDADTFSELLAEGVELKEDGQPLHRYLSMKVPLDEGVFLPTKIRAKVLSPVGWRLIVAEFASSHRDKSDDEVFLYVCYELFSFPLS